MVSENRTGILMRPELDYVLGGRARMIILSPGGSVDTFEVGPGEVVFYSYWHFFTILKILHSVNNMHMAVFFGNARPTRHQVFREGLAQILTRYWVLLFNLPPTYLTNFLNLNGIFL